MEWWQITLITLGAIAAGILVGFLTSRLISRFFKGQFVRKHDIAAAAKEQRREEMAAVEGHGGEVSSIANEQRHKEIINMVPLLSRRSVIALAIGLAVGIGLGLGYWAISPALAEFQTGMSSVQVASGNTALYESTANVQIMNRGASSVSVTDLKRKGEYYAAKMNTVLFFEFLSQKVAELAPQYSHSPEELVQMIRVRYDYKSDNPAIEIKVTSLEPTTLYYQDVSFIASITADVFQDYLAEEERTMRLEEYQNKLKERESTRTALIDAEKELANLMLQENTYDINQDPTYITLKVKIEALELELKTQAGRLAVLIAGGDTGQDYRDVLAGIERASLALSETKSELSSLEARVALEYLEESLVYSRATTKVEGLRQQLDDLTKSLVSPVIENNEGDVAFYDLVVGKPSIPTPIPPDRLRGRNAMMLGAILGLGIAFLVLNYKWLAKGMPSSGEEDEEDEV